MKWMKLLSESKRRISGKGDKIECSKVVLKEFKCRYDCICVLIFLSLVAPLVSLSSTLGSQWLPVISVSGQPASCQVMFSLCRSSLKVLRHVLLGQPRFLLRFQCHPAHVYIGNLFSGSFDMCPVILIRCSVTTACRGLTFAAWRMASFIIFSW